MMKSVKYMIILAIICALQFSCTPIFENFKSINNSPLDWEMFRNNLTGYYQKGTYGSDLVRLIWKAKLKSKCYNSPVATGSYVAVSGLDGYIYFYDIESGQRINIYKLRSPLSQSPMISDRMIFIAAGPRQNLMIGLNLVTGSLIFKEKRPDIQAPIIGDANRLYCGDYSGHFTCSDKFSGKTIWEFQAGAPIMNAPAVIDQYVLFGSLDHNIYALDLKTGQLVWKFKAEGAINSAPAADTLVYFGSYSQEVYAISLSRGELVWKFMTDGQVLSSPVIDDHYLYIGSNDKKLYCLEKATGRKVWEFQTKGVISSVPLVLEDVVVTGSCDGYVYMLDKSNGRFIFSFKTGDMIKSSPIYFNNKIFVSSADSHLYCFGR